MLLFKSGLLATALLGNVAFRARARPAYFDYEYEYHFIEYE